MVAFNLYSKMPFGQIHDYQPDIVKLAELLGRPPASLSMKMCNLATLDPQHSGRIKGLRVAKIERAVWNEYHANPGQFMLETEKLTTQLAKGRMDNLILEPEIAELPKGETKLQLVNARVNQHLFRKVVLTSYNNQCCMTGIAQPELLNASHIKPWRDDPDARINPQNGLCLNALHDRAFDRGLISVAPDLIVHVSSKLKDAIGDAQKLNFILNCAGKPITQPKRFAPDKKFLAYHYANIFQH